MTVIATICTKLRCFWVGSLGAMRCNMILPRKTISKCGSNGSAGFNPIRCNIHRPGHTRNDHRPDSAIHHNPSALPASGAGVSRPGRARAVHWFAASLDQRLAGRRGGVRLIPELNPCCHTWLSRSRYSSKSRQWYSRWRTSCGTSGSPAVSRYSKPSCAASPRRSGSFRSPPNGARSQRKLRSPLAIDIIGERVQQIAAIMFVHHAALLPLSFAQRYGRRNTRLILPQAHARSGEGAS